jgi:ribosome-associated protein
MDLSGRRPIYFSKGFVSMTTSSTGTTETSKTTKTSKTARVRDLKVELDLYIQAALSRKAEGLVVLDVRELTSIADAFIICSGRSNRQVSAIAENIQKFLRERGIRPLNVEGTKEGHWVLMDYGHIIIHVFYEETRFFYDLEGLWADARRITTPNMKEEQNKAEPFEGEEIIVD